jgi:ribosomal protein L32
MSKDVLAMLEELIENVEGYLEELERAIDVLVNEGRADQIVRGEMLKKELVNHYVIVASFYNRLNLLKASEELRRGNKPSFKMVHVMKCKRCGSIFNALRAETEEDDRTGGTVIWRKCPKCGEWNLAEVLGQDDYNTSNYLDNF